MIVVDGVAMVDVHEAADLSRRTPETIRRWVWSGRLRAVKSDNKLYVARADVAPAPESVASPGLAVRDWAELLPSGAGGTGGSARDLVLENRNARASR